MEDNNKKKKAKIILVAIVSLLVLVLGSAYAYFQVSTVNNFGTKNIYADTGDYGSVVIEGIDASLTMNLTASELMYDYTQQTPAPVIYYAGTSGATTTPTEVTVGVARVNPNTDTNYYHCTYDISVTHTGTNDMYDKFNSKTNNVYDYTNRSEGQIALLINGVEYDWGSEDGMPSLIHADLYMRGTETKNITAGLKFVSSDQIDQSYITGTDIDIEVNLVPNTLRCTVLEPASTTLIALTEDSNNATKIEQYTGKVTDRYQDYGTGVDATKVYIFKSNDISNVIFEDYCWKIIRTTETGGVKLLYNGLPSNGECTATGASTMLTAAQMGTPNNTIRYNNYNDYPGDVGYMYNAKTGTYGNQLIAADVNKNDSILKEKTEYWFSNSGIDEYKLEDAVYCNDRSMYPEYGSYSQTSGYVYFATVNFSGSYDSYNKKTLECGNQTDAFSISNSKAKTNYKVGFLTSPEARLATYNVYGNTGSYFYWLGSPSTYNGGSNMVFGGSSINAGFTTAYNGVRPVVSVSLGVQVTGGTGSTTDPFIFE